MKTHTLKRLAGLSALIAAGLSTTTAHAQSVKLDRWGDVSIVNPQQIQLSTAALGESPASGTDALWIDQLEASLKLTPGLLGLDAFEGSAVQATFSSTAAVKISFSWQLVSDQASSTPGLDDRAFLIVDGQPLVELGTWQGQGQFSHTFSTAGLHSLAIGVVDVGDTVGVSQLSLSQLQVSAVPEPESWALMALGLAGLVAARRRR